jgi:hypothetical protein
VIPVAKTPGEFIRYDGSKGYASAAKIADFCRTELIPLDYFFNKGVVRQQGEIVAEFVAGNILYGNREIVLKNCVQREASSMPCCLFYDESKQPLSGEGAYITTPSDTVDDVTLEWGVNIPSNAKFVVINFRHDGYIVSPGGGGESVSVDDALIAKFNKYALSWVDDDMDFSNYNGHNAKYICDALSEDYHVDCKCDLAIQPDRTHYKDDQEHDIAYSPNGDYPTNDRQYFTDAKVSIIKEWQRQGFHFQVHPIHKGWWTGGSNGYTFQGVAFCEQSLIKCMEAFREAGIFHDPCIVYPQGSGGSGYEAVQEMVKRWMDFGISATSMSDPYNAGVKDPYKTRRLFLNFNEKSPNNNYSVKDYKNIIDTAYAEGAWVIIGTHCFQATDDISNRYASTNDLPPAGETGVIYRVGGAVNFTEYVWKNGAYERADDEILTGFTLSNIIQVVKHAIEVAHNASASNPYQPIQPVHKVWNKRKMMFELYNS